MDQYSLHEFLIRRGSTVDSTPEFLSFHRTYAKQWGPIAELVLQLEVRRQAVAPPVPPVALCWQMGPL